jgi:inhibitor of KinA sporulation pathway (predicted exonuclease)
MNLMSLDLEFNQPSGKIIQVGVCILDTKTGHIFAEKRIYIKLNEQLNPDISKLTGIEEEVLKKDGVSLIDAYEIILEMKTKHHVFTNPITWGLDDGRILKDQLYGMKLFGRTSQETHPWIFGGRSMDTKTLYQTRKIYLGEPTQSGLAKSLTRVGLNFKGKKHDALDDAINTARLFHLLANDFCSNE